MSLTMTYGQKESALEAAITASLPDDDDEYSNWVWVCDFTDNYVIYSTNSEYFQDDYTMDDDGQITMAGKPVPVWPSTTYVPVQQESAFQSAMEERGLLAVRSKSTTRIASTVPTVRVKSEPLTYHRHSRTSYFADLLLRHKDGDASERLNRHAAEMEVIRRERDAKAWQALRAGELEYRVEPNTTDGYGGYLAPPLWINEFFATAVRPGRVLAGLMPKFDLPMGISQVNLPILATGTRTRHLVDTTGVPDGEITDTAGSSNVVTIAGQADVPLQMLEQSPVGAHLDWALLKDMAEDYDRDLETQLLAGHGSAFDELLGVVNADTELTFSSGAPTASLMWAYFGYASAQIGDARDLPPEVWLMRTARWSWLSVAEDTSGRPFGIPAPFFLGSDPDTPDPVGGLISWPVFLDDAIPANLGAGANQDLVVCMRPTDLILLEGQPQTAVMTEVLSGSLGARIQLHARVAAITNRYPTSIVSIQGTGMVVQNNF